MKLSLATLMALMVAVARTAPVPGDNTLVDAEILNDSVKNVGNNAASGLLKEVDGLVKELTSTLGGLLKRGDDALIEADVLNDSVKNVGNNALSGLVDELSGLLGQLTDALGGLLKRGVDTETTDNALIKAGVANDAVKDVLNNAAKRDEDLLGGLLDPLGGLLDKRDEDLGIGTLLKRDENLLGLEGDHGHHDDNALIKAGVANDAVKDVLNNAAKRDEDLLGGILAKRDEAIDDNAIVNAKVANNAVKDVLNDLAKRGDNTEAKNNTLIKLSILNNALKNLLNNLL
ncbi:uncharacterized protein ASPGLDRAFT_50236 [Aspergillus glaucus CBS 516.65]|uniref:Uncharacterized protein n=1 Tax=Aspergillus glaucus CBS 516.65 TaxID=1160497 RepID=A0A1L9VCQ3_ASPGL|nr:hypothetical protein ASPGLDRAFT_50236 [Aspergillus glaucus CBS 516.65]OJJ81690.1 hypothetical protein ASPGLDRAFT_50236 [Aspergillus glaucus CBS 516.65]